MMKKRLVLLMIFMQSIGIIAQNLDYKIVPLPNNDILIAPKQKRIYASVPSSIPKYGNSICRINPNSGIIESSIWVGSEPNTLAISDDEKYLYIGFAGTPRVKKLNLLTNKIEQEIIMAHDTLKDHYGYVSGDIFVMPQRPNTYVITRKSTIYYPSYGGIVVMDSVKRRTKLVDGYDESTSLLATSDTTKFFGVDNQGRWYKYGIDASGVTKLNTYSPMAGNGKNLLYSAYDSLYYARDGYNFDLRSGTPIGKQFASSPGFSLPDPLNANIYYFSGLNEGVDVKIYNRKTRVPIDQIILPFRMFYIGKGLNWGTSGQMALRSFDKIAIFNSCTSTAPKPSITEGVNLTLCPKQTVKLTASGNAARYYWSTGDSTKTITVKAEGTYSVGMADANGCVNYSDFSTVKAIQYVSTPDIYRSNFDESLCKGVAAKLYSGSLNDPNKYEWSNGKIGQFIDVIANSTLTVVAVTPDGCRSSPSNPYVVKFFDNPTLPKPAISILGETNTCIKTTVKLMGPSGYATYKWSSSNVTQNFTATIAFSQTFSLKVADEFGCYSLSSDTLKVTIKDTPYQPIIFNSGNIMSSFNDAGVQWFLNGEAIAGATKRSYTALTNGFYSMQVTNPNGCVSPMSNLINITTITSVNNLGEGQKFEAFPNPASDVLSIYTEGVPDATVSLADAYGRIVRVVALKSKGLIMPINELVSGVYTIHLSDGKGQILSIKKIIKL